MKIYYQTTKPNKYLIKCSYLYKYELFCIYVTRTVYMYAGNSITFQTLFVQTFKIAEDFWKFSILLLYILCDDWPIFMISGSSELLKPDCHSWWILKMQSGCEDTLEERYTIKFCFKLDKKSHRNVWNASDCFGTILHESSNSFWVA